MSIVTSEPPRARRLPAEPASAGRARRFVSEVLGDWNLDSITDVATLLVSEVVTNAVLHAGTDLTVQLRRSSACLRVEVADGSTQSAARRHYDRDATTGRGLALVETLSDDWGVDAATEGKTVWFDMRLDTAVGFEGTRWSPAAVSPTGSVAPAGAVDDEREVRLEGAPLRLLRASVQMGDSVLRETALLALSGEVVLGEPSRWQPPAIDLARVLGPAEEALGEGHQSADLTVTFPMEACEAALRRLSLIEEADRLAAEGELLTLPSLPEVAACRRWYLGEITRQMQGGPPTRWELPEPEERPAEVAILDASERNELLERLSGPAIAADGTNHIVFANPAAAQLLGWSEDELVGRRLTVIVPPELREAHLAGYTRYQVTGETAIIGSPVTVPALHSDGSRVMVELTIDLLPRSAGVTGVGANRTAFLARLRPV